MWWLLLPPVGFGVSGPFICAEVHECLGVEGQAVSRSQLGVPGLHWASCFPPPPLAYSLLDRALHSYTVDLLAQFLLL